MGLAGSQCRLLMLTARLSDLELEAQIISNAKIRLAVESSQAAEDYTDALYQQKLTYKTIDADGEISYVDLNAAMLINYDPTSLNRQRLLKDSYGRTLVSENIANSYQDSNTGTTYSLDEFIENCGYTTDTTSDQYDPAAVAYYTNMYNSMQAGGYFTATNDQLASEDYLHNQLNNGNLFLYLSVANDDDDDIQDGFKMVSWQSGDPSIIEERDDDAVAIATAEYEAICRDIEVQDKMFDLRLKNIDTEHNATQTEIESVTKVINGNIERNFKMFQA